jgi:hypothetical protein
MRDDPLMADSVEFTSEPAPEVLRYFRAKRLTPSFDWRDVWANEHAVAFTVAKAVKLDVLETLRQAVDDAIAKGETFASFRANLEPKLRALGWWGRKDMVDPETGKEAPAQLGSPRRLRTIYNANIRSAFAAGIWERAQRSKATRPFFAYRLGPSIVHRPHHVAREGMVYPVDHPIWDTWFPPNGWGCKCWVLQITREDAESFGYSDDTPEPLIQTRGYVNKRTGELEQIPIGIDPGWHNNPAKFRAENLRAFLASRLEAAPKLMRDAAVRDTVSSWLFRLIHDRKINASHAEAPIAVLSEGQGMRTVFFDTQSAANQAGSGLASSDYTVVQQLIDNGIQSSTPAGIEYAGEAAGRSWRLIIGHREGRLTLLSLDQVE